MTDSSPLHLNPRQAGEVATAAGARRLVLTHLRPSTAPEQAIRLARKTYHGKDAPYVDRELPLELADAEIRPVWEGQPDPDIPEYLLLSRVKQQWVDVRVFFGTQQPSQSLLEEAQAGLEQLNIPDPA
jgi:hypothetical protein